MTRPRRESLNNKTETKLILMKTKNLLTSILLVAALCAATQTSNAGQRVRSGSFQNSRGHSGTFVQTIDRQPGQYSRVTTADGRTATVDQTVGRTGDTATVDGSRTGFDGKTSSWNDKMCIRDSFYYVMNYRRLLIPRGRNLKAPLPNDQTLRTGNGG